MSIIPGIILTALMAFDLVKAFPSDIESINGGMATMSGSSGCSDIVVGYYSDSECTQIVGEFCVLVSGDFQPGQYSCGAANFPADVAYAMVLDASDYSSLQVDFSADATCPPPGPGAVDATLIDNDACVAIAVTGSSAGYTVYPAGGAPIAGPVKHSSGRRRRKAPAATQVKGKRQSSVTCSGFQATSSVPSEGPSQQVSPIVNCQTSADNCPITTSDETTITQTSSYSATVGVSIFGVSASATVGASYSESETSSIEEGFTVAVGQNGYLTAYCAATLFYGVYSGCSGDTASLSGTMLALKNNGFTYEVVNTGA